jgi:hypothetical protein
MSYDTYMILFQKEEEENMNRCLKKTD